MPAEITDIAVYALAAAAALGLCLVAWRLTRGASAAVKILAGLGLLVVLAAPVVLMTLGTELSRTFEEVGAPMAPAPEAPASRNGKSYAPAPSSPSGGAAMPGGLGTSVDKRSLERSIEPGTGAGGSTEMAPERGLELPRSFSEPSGGGAPGAAAPKLDAPAAGAEPSDSAPAPAAPPVTATEQGEWDVVPVFYGTDRAQLASAERVNFGSGRGRRLVLGRALVTVPRAHVIPSIERPWALHIPFLNVTVYEEAEDPNKHFTMKEITALSPEDFLALVRERLGASVHYKDQAFIFVHGYNTSFDYAIFRAAQIAYDLKFDGASFAYSWPSGGGLASYTYDRESSGQSEPFLKEFMQIALEKSGAKAVSVIAHSMGNQPMLQVLRDLKAVKPDGVVINQIILAAPDVDRDNFENIAQEIKGLAKGITLYAAANDRALSVSRNFNGGVPRAGDVPAEGPLVLDGIDTIDVTAVSMDSLGLNHSGYAENNALLNDIGLLIQTGERPPRNRIPILEEIATPKGAYWRYPLAR